MESFINDNFVAWASNIKYPQGYQVNNILGATAYPYIAVLCCNPVGGNLYIIYYFEFIVLTCD